MPFQVAWTDGIGKPGFAESFIGFHLGFAGSVGAGRWSLDLGVCADGEPMGCQGISGERFAETRRVVTGSWLGQRFQGRGYGTEMRAAVLELAFAGLGAEVAVSGHADGNAQSMRVSEKLGYEPAGEGFVEPRGYPIRHFELELARDRWAASKRIPVVVEGLEACRRFRALDREPARLDRWSASMFDAARSHYAGPMAAPVQRDEELELHVDSLAFGGNGVARLDGFVVFVRAGLPGDTVRARVTKVQRRHAEAITTEVLEAGPQRVRRHARTTRPAAAAGSRISPTTRSSPPSRRGSRTRSAGSRASSTRRSSRSSRPRSSSATATRWSTPSRPGPTAARRSSACIAPAAGTRCSRSTSATSRPSSATGSGTRSRDWAHEERLPAYDQANHKGYLRHLIIREGRNTGQALVQLVTHERERFDRERLIEVLVAHPEVRSIQWTVNDTAGRGHEPADAAPLG